MPVEVAQHPRSSPAIREVPLAGGAVDLVTRAVRVGSRADRLTQREAEVLSFLARNPGRTVSRDEMFREVFGIHRATVSRAVDTTISRLRNKIEPDPDQPVHLISVFGEGYRFEPGAALTPAAQRIGVPPERTPLVGRRREVRAVLEALEAHRAVALVGTGGVGKSRLAARVASEAAADLVLFVPLAEATSAAEAVDRVARALGVRDRGLLADAAAHVARLLDARGEVLLVLDCTEHLQGVLAPILDGWRDAVPRLKLLATTRIPLRTRHPVHDVPLDCLDPEAAATLYVERAAAAGASVHPDDLDTVRMLVASLDHLPLAIELAAARARTLTAEQMCDRLDARLRILRLPSPRGAEPRQESLRAALDWSWELLPEPERRALCRLSVFPARITPAAAAAVVGPDAEQRLPRLVEASLLQRAEDGFALLESVRIWAAEKAVERGERADAELAHAAFHVAWLAEVQPRSLPLRREALVRIDAELPHLLVIPARSAEARPDLAVEAVLHLWEAFQVQGPLEPYLEALDIGVAAARRAGHPDLPRVLRARAMTVRTVGRGAEAEADLREAVALQRAVDPPDDSVVAWLEGDLALVLAEVGRFDDAEALLEDVLPRLAPHRRPGARATLASLFMRRGRDPRLVEEMLRTSLAESEAAGQERLACGTRANLGLLLADTFRVEEAEVELTRAVEALRHLGAIRRLPAALLALGAVRVLQGRLDEADALAADTEALGRLCGSGRHQALAILARASLELVFGDHEDALRRIDEAEQLLGPSTEQWVVPLLESYRAVLLAAADRLEPAAAAAARAAAGRRSSGQSDFGFEAAVDGHLAWAEVRRARGQGADPGPARARVRSALASASPGSVGARFLLGLLPADGG